MENKIKKFIDSIKEIWEVARKPTTDEVKKIIYTTFLIFFIVAGISLAIFIIVQYLLYIWQFMW
ncbi:hypothetical protein BA065_00325 [Nanoarchaeota archaeon NZ13-N]|uniref:Protein translocase subunit SecE n=1 Tax=Candidatus Nanoclepta minutus TaxID=1940235 RepID=A0A397WRC8_9ARCH|nr:MAG: hypothetical protein BA065_00325 [Nanoarchaeota archaeon NZ13-N]RIB35623.1 MAG: hypothetical protein BXU00_00790 [Candidatus Nanoclepta minutus]